MGLDHGKSADGRGLYVLFDLFARAIFKHLKPNGQTSITPCFL